MFDKRKSEAPVKQQPTSPFIHLAGKVIRVANGLSGGYKTGSTATIHLAVLLDRDAASKADVDLEIMTIQGTDSFTDLPLARVGDRVEFTIIQKEGYHYHNGERLPVGRYRELVTVGIVWTKQPD